MFLDTISTVANKRESTLPPSFKPGDFETLSKQAAQRQRLESTLQESGAESLPEILNTPSEGKEAELMNFAGSIKTTTDIASLELSNGAKSVTGEINRMVQSAIIAEEKKQAEQNTGALGHLNNAGRWLKNKTLGIGSTAGSVLDRFNTDLKTGAVGLNFRQRLSENFTSLDGKGSSNLITSYQENTKYIKKVISSRLKDLEKLPEDVQQMLIPQIENQLRQYKLNFLNYVNDLKKLGDNPTEEEIKSIKPDAYNSAIKQEGLLGVTGLRMAVTPVAFVAGISTGGFGVALGLGALRSSIGFYSGEKRREREQIADALKNAAMEAAKELKPILQELNRELDTENPSKEVFDAANSLITQYLNSHHLLTGETKFIFEELQDKLTAIEVGTNTQPAKTLEENKQGENLPALVEKINKIQDRLREDTSEFRQGKLTSDIKEKNKTKEARIEQAKRFGLALGFSMLGIAGGITLRSALSGTLSAQLESLSHFATGKPNFEESVDLTGDGVKDIIVSSHNAERIAELEAQGFDVIKEGGLAFAVKEGQEIDPELLINELGKIAEDIPGLDANDLKDYAGVEGLKSVSAKNVIGGQVIGDNTLVADGMSGETYNVDGKLFSAIGRDIKTGEIVFADVNNAPSASKINSLIKEGLIDPYSADWAIDLRRIWNDGIDIPIFGNVIGKNIIRVGDLEAAGFDFDEYRDLFGGNWNLGNGINEGELQRVIEEATVNNNLRAAELLAEIEEMATNNNDRNVLGAIQVMRNNISTPTSAPSISAPGVAHASTHITAAAPDPLAPTPVNPVNPTPPVVPPSSANTSTVFDSNSSINNGVQIFTGASPEEIVKLTAPLQAEVDAYRVIFQNFGSNGIDSSEAAEILADYPNLPNTIQEQFELIQNSSIPGEITLNNNILEVTAFEPFSIGTQYLNPTVRQIIKGNIDSNQNFDIDNAIHQLEAEIGRGSGQVDPKLVTQLEEVRDSGSPITVGNGGGEATITARIPQVRSVNLGDIEDQIDKIEDAASSGGGNVTISNIHNNVINGDDGSIEQNIQTPTSEVVAPTEVDTSAPQETLEPPTSTETDDVSTPEAVADTVVGDVLGFNKKGLGGYARIMKTLVGMDKEFLDSIGIDSDKLEEILPMKVGDWNELVAGLSQEQKEKILSEVIEKQVSIGSEGFVNLTDDDLKEVVSKICDASGLNKDDCLEKALTGKLEGSENISEAFTNFLEERYSEAEEFTRLVGEAIRGITAENPVPLAGSIEERVVAIQAMRDFRIEETIEVPNGKSIQYLVDSSHSNLRSMYETDTEWSVIDQGGVTIAIKQPGITPELFEQGLYDDMIMAHLRTIALDLPKDDVTFDDFSVFENASGNDVDGLYSIPADTNITGTDKTYGLGEIITKGTSGHPVTVFDKDSGEYIKLFVVGEKDGELIFANSEINPNVIKNLKGVTLYSEEGPLSRFQRWVQSFSGGADTDSTPETETTDTSSTPTEVVTTQESTEITDTDSSEITPESATPTPEVEVTSFEESFPKLFGISSEEYLNIGQEGGVRFVNEKLQELGLGNSGIDPFALDKAFYDLVKLNQEGVVTEEQARSILSEAGIPSDTRLSDYWGKLFSSEGLPQEEADRLFELSKSEGWDGVGDVAGKDFNFTVNGISVPLPPEYSVYLNQEGVDNWSAQIAEYSSLTGGMDQKKAEALMNYVSKLEDKGAVANGEMLSQVVELTNQAVAEGKDPAEAVEAITGVKPPKDNAFFDSAQEASEEVANTTGVNNQKGPRPEGPEGPEGINWVDLGGKVLGASIVGGVAATAISALDRNRPNWRQNMFYQVGASFIAPATFAAIASLGFAPAVIGGVAGYLVKDKIADKYWFAPNEPQDPENQEPLESLTDRNYRNMENQVSREFREADNVIQQVKTLFENYQNTTSQQKIGLETQLAGKKVVIKRLYKQLKQREQQFGNINGLNDANKQNARDMLSQIKLKIQRLNQAYKDVFGEDIEQGGTSPETAKLQEIATQYNTLVQSWNNLSAQERQNNAKKQSTLAEFDQLIQEYNTFKTNNSQNSQIGEYCDQAIATIRQAKVAINAGQQIGGEQPPTPEGQGELSQEEKQRINNSLEVIDTTTGQDRDNAIINFMNLFKNPDGSINERKFKAFQSEFTTKNANYHKQNNSNISEQQAIQLAKDDYNSYIVDSILSRYDQLVASGQIQDGQGRAPLDQQNNMQDFRRHPDLKERLQNMPEIRNRPNALNNLRTINTSLHDNINDNINNPNLSNIIRDSTLDFLHIVSVTPGLRRDGIRNLFGPRANATELSEAQTNMLQIFNKLGLDYDMINRFFSQPESIPSTNDIRLVGNFAINEKNSGSSRLDMTLREVRQQNSNITPQILSLIWPYSENGTRDLKSSIAAFLYQTSAKATIVNIVTPVNANNQNNQGANPLVLSQNPQQAFDDIVNTADNLLISFLS